MHDQQLSLAVIAGIVVAAVLVLIIMIHFSLAQDEREIIRSALTGRFKGGLGRRRSRRSHYRRRSSRHHK